MSTFYLDYELGNDANDGSAWGAGTAWKTITSGATAGRIAPGDIVRIAKSPAPTSIGNGIWTTNTKVGGGMPATLAITATANNGSGLIRVTVASTATLTTNDVVQILSTGGTIEANSNWIITVINGTTFDLVGSTFTNAWTSGGTVQLINAKAVVLDTAQTAKIDSCDTNFTAATGVITVLNATPTAGGTGYTQGDILTITTGGTGAQCTATTVVAGAVTVVTLLKGGNGTYTTGAAKATTGGTGTLCTVNITTVANATSALVAVATDGKEGSSSLRVTTPSGVVKGSKLAYRAISPGSLTAYQKLSFWIKNSSALLATDFRICLCSDSAGETVVDEFLISAIPSTSQFVPLTITKTGGGNLDASIASISIYSGTTSPVSASNILLDNIIACTTSGLNLQSLISTNTLEQGGTEGWYGIQSINGKIVLLDNSVNTLGNAGVGYSGTSQTTTTYIRETIKTAIAPISSTVVQASQDSGTIGSNIEFQGGYNTSNSVQDGETFFDGLNGMGYGLQIPTKTYNTINRLNFSRYNTGLYLLTNSNSNIITNLSNSSNNTSRGVWLDTCSYNTFTTISNTNNNQAQGIFIQGASSFNTFTTISNSNNNLNSGIACITTTANNNTFTTVTNANNNTSGFVTTGFNWIIGTISNVNFNSGSGFTFGTGGNCILTTLSNANSNGTGVNFSSSNNNKISLITNANNNSTTGLVYTSASFNTVDLITNCNNNGTGVSIGTNANLNKIGNLTTSGNVSAGISNASSRNFIRNTTIGESIPVTGYTDFGDSRVFTQLTNGYSYIYTDGGHIISQASTLSNGSGKEWKLVVGETTAATVSNSNRQSYYPLTLSISKIAVTANNQVSVSAWFKKSHATDIISKLVCRGGQLAGVSNDVTATKANDTSEEQLTIQFTPTETGVIEIEVWAYIASIQPTLNTNVVFDNSAGSTVRGTLASHGLTTGDTVSVSGLTNALANTNWVVTVIDSSTFTIDSAVWATHFTGADVTGNVVRFGNVIIDAITATQV